MTKVDIEKLIYKKPKLALGLNSLYHVDRLTGEDEIPVEDEGEDNSIGTGTPDNG